MRENKYVWGNMTLVNLRPPVSRGALHDNAGIAFPCQTESVVDVLKLKKGSLDRSGPAPSCHPTFRLSAGSSQPEAGVYVHTEKWAAGPGPAPYL